MEIRFAKNPGVVTRQVVGETILIPLTKKMGEQACLYTLDETAAFLWERLDGQASGRDLALALKTAYEIDLERAEADVCLFLEELRSVNAIELASGSRAGNE